MLCQILLYLESSCSKQQEKKKSLHMDRIYCSFLYVSRLSIHYSRKTEASSNLWCLTVLQLYRMDFQLATVVRKMVLTKQVCLCHPTIQAVLGRSYRHVCRPPGKALYFPWKSVTAVLRHKAGTKQLLTT